MSKWLSQFTPRVGSWIGLGLMSALSGLMVAVLFMPILAVGGVTLKNTIGVLDSMPDFVDLDRLAQRNDIYAQTNQDPANGYTKIASVYWQNREEVGWGDVSQFLKDAAVAGEDRRFYQHRGVDLTGLIRAAVGNVVSGSVQSGASTLTMQVIKNVFVQRAEALPTEKERKAAYEAAVETSFKRKFQEIRMAVALEKRYTKEQILLAYLNISNFGGNTYGVEAAAQYYFGKSAKDLDLAESASLLAIVQAPQTRNLSDPKYYEANRSRRDVILTAMLQEGYITRDQYQKAVDTKVDENFVHITAPKSGCIAADDYSKWFCDFVVKNVGNFEALGGTKEERINNWHMGGYKLYTTMNYELQKTAQSKTWKVPRDEKKLQLGSAQVSIQVGTGRILTMTSNKLFNDTLQGGGREATAVNFATDRDYGGSSGFQSGSTYKLFGLLTWLKAGHGLNELVDASEFTKDQGNYLDTCTDGGGPWHGEWKFGNDMRAAKIISVANAVKWSVNSAFASITEQLDQCDIRHTAESLGMHRADGTPLRTNPSAILGTNEISPLALAAAYAGVANNGRYCEPIVLDRVVSPAGEELPGQTSKCSQGVEPDIAHAAIYAMKAVVASGTGTPSNPHDGIPIFGKTGTTNDATQTWMIASTSTVTSVAWVGNIVGKYRIRSYPNGAKFRHQILLAVIKQANKMYGGKDWAKPSAKLLAGKSVTVPALRGLTVEAATTLLEGLGFEVQVGPSVISELDDGLVISSTPAEGSKLASGMTITLTPSIKQILLTMPDFVTVPVTERNALRMLTQMGVVTVRNRCEVAASGTDPLIGYVTSQYPSAGTEFAPDASVRITVRKATCQ